MELRRQQQFAGRFIVLQSILLIVALGGMLGDTSTPFLGLYLWAVLPLLMSLRFLREQLTDRGRFERAWIQMLPHLGSTAMIGISVYVFRLLILLIVGKVTAGDLYTAFAIGGIVGSVFAHALGPSLVLHEVRTGERYLPMALKISMWLWLCGGAILFLVSQFGSEALAWTGKTDLFLGATGLSMIGGVVMVFAQRIKLRLLQATEGKDVYGPDVLMNILTVVSVPYLYYLLGKDALMTLYVLNSIFALLFYASSKSRISLNEQRNAVSAETWRKLIAFLLFFPLFFQLSGNIFHEATFLFDSRGALMRVPLPVSIIACFVGIPILGGYKRAYLSLGVIFLSFVLMLTSAIVSTHGRMVEEQGKIILLLQFIVPMCALVLGQVFETEENSCFFEKVILYIVSVLVPVQLLVSWLQGYVLLSPYLYIFSIYQHLQYVPVIFVCGYLLAVYSLWSLPQYKKILFILAPLMGIYVVASASMLAMGALIGGMLGCVLYRWKPIYDRSLTVCFLLVVIASSTYVGVLKNSGFGIGSGNILHIGNTIRRGS
jgi:hypothetical protein